MSEREPSHQGEQLKPIETAEVERINQQLAERLEVTGEQIQTTSEQLQTAREQLERHAEVSSPYESHHEPAHHHRPTKLDQMAEYKTTLRSLQRKLPATSRAFSKFIHNPVVDNASEVIGNTVLRPSVTLGATTTALAVGGFFYLTARRYGFPLRGSEIAVSLLVGGCLGILAEVAAKFVKRLRGH